MRVADGVGVRPGFVHGGVNVESRFVDSPATRSRVLVSSNDATRVNVKADHIASAKASEMSAEGIHPHQIGVFWVSKGNMTGLTFCVAHTSPVSRYSSHVNQDVSSVLSERGEGRKVYGTESITVRLLLLMLIELANLATHPRGRLLHSA